MKSSILLMFIFLIVISCSTNSKTNVIIKSNQDTVQYGETFRAELYVPYKNGFLPAFYIILREEDTARLPIDTVKRCAVFRAAGRGKGEKIFVGFVKYIDKKGKKRNEKFSIKYFVKH